jgi:DNA-binding response OmpR family regulator
MKILIIEDDKTVRDFITSTLEEANHRVIEAENGLIGMKILHENKDTDLVITDIIMPEKEGIEIIRDIRNQYQGIKIIAISGGGRIVPEDYLALAETFGAHKTLKKPFKASELLNSIATL